MTIIFGDFAEQNWWSFKLVRLIRVRFWPVSACQSFVIVREIPNRHTISFQRAISMDGWMGCGFTLDMIKNDLWLTSTINECGGRHDSLDYDNDCSKENYKRSKEPSELLLLLRAHKQLV